VFESGFEDTHEQFAFQINVFPFKPFCGGDILDCSTLDFKGENVTSVFGLASFSGSCKFFLQSSWGPFLLCKVSMTDKNCQGDDT
jgi:hypothetical protein